MHRSNGRSQIQHPVAEDTEAPFVELLTIQRTRLSIDRHNHRLITDSEGNTSKLRFRY